MIENYQKPNPAVVIKQTVKSDIPKILDIQTECHLSIWTAEDYQKELERKDSLLLSAKFEGTLIGFMMIRMSSPASHLTDESAQFAELDILNFGVSQKYQKLGIGGLLFERLLNKTAGLNLESFWLEVRESNLDAINFYKKKGFLKVQVRKNFYRQPTENAIVMKLNLSELP